MLRLLGAPPKRDYEGEGANAVTAIPAYGEPLDSRRNPRHGRLADVGARGELHDFSRIGSQVDPDLLAIVE
jgi:hypothetical protein